MTSTVSSHCILFSSSLTTIYVHHLYLYILLYSTLLTIIEKKVEEKSNREAEANKEVMKER